MAFQIQFQSTRPVRGATIQWGQLPPLVFYFNPRAPRGARHAVPDTWKVADQFQSTRPARGATGWSAVVVLFRLNFNPRAPRGARPNGCKHRFHTMNFNPRAPRGARPTLDRYDRLEIEISIHAPREGRDHHERPGAGGTATFQSTRPARGATEAYWFLWYKDIWYFNPRAPRGARLSLRLFVRLLRKFQSTRPARGATPKRETSTSPLRISIHAPREGRDSCPYGSHKIT